MAAQSPARTVDEELPARGAEGGPPVLKIGGKHLLHGVVQRDKAFLGALAENAHQPPLQVQIQNVQIAQLGDAQPRRVQHLQHTAVARACFNAAVWLGQQSLHFILAQHLRQMQGELGIFQQQSGVFGHRARVQGKGKKSPQGRKPPRQGAPRVLVRPQPGEVEENFLLVRRGRKAAAAQGQFFLKQKKIFQVLAVGLHGTDGQTALGQQMVRQQRRQRRRKGRALRHGLHASRLASGGQGAGMAAAFPSGKAVLCRVGGTRSSAVLLQCPAILLPEIRRRRRYAV